ncbi:hypothetical protein FOA52_004623 [Chlamydomonas sp. UWO 241]|nr:hypothetical protein FOA52_004623 [Chlamydomonas sp. UWO 241]
MWRSWSAPVGSAGLTGHKATTVTLRKTGHDLVGGHRLCVCGRVTWRDPRVARQDAVEPPPCLARSAAPWSILRVEQPSHLQRSRSAQKCPQAISPWIPPLPVPLPSACVQSCRLVPQSEAGCSRGQRSSGVGR